MVSIAHWLDTFTCSKYADRFERSGYLNLQSVCQLTVPQLQNLGIAPNDISTIMENVLLLKQSVKSLEPMRYLDLNSEPPSSMVRSRTASPAINNINRSMSQNSSAYSPGPNMSTPPASSGPSPDRAMTGPPSSFDGASGYQRSNSYSNPVNPNTFLDISPTSSTSSPHRSGSLDAYPSSIEPGSYNEYPNQPPSNMPPHPHPHAHSHHHHHPHPYPNPNMMYRPNHPPGPAGYYNTTHRFYSLDGQQQPPPPQQSPYMYPNQRMMMHTSPQQPHVPWSGHRTPMPPQNNSHQMQYHGYEHHQYRMPNLPQYHSTNHSVMSDQNQMFMNAQQQHINPPSTKMPNSGESHPHPLQSLERLVLLPESQVVDPKSVVNEIHDPQSPFSESLSPYATSSPKNPVATPPTATVVSNLLTNEKSVIDQHGKNSNNLKRGSTHDDRHDRHDHSKKNRTNTSLDSSTGDSIVNNHPVVTSLLTRGLNNSSSQAPLPSIKSLQQKHNPAFMQQPQTTLSGTQPLPSMMYGQNQPDPQQFVDGLMIYDNEKTMLETKEQDFEHILDKIRLKMDLTSKFEQKIRLENVRIPSQFDGLSESTNVVTKSSDRSSRKRLLSGRSDSTMSEDEQQSNGSIKNGSNSSTTGKDSIKTDEHVKITNSSTNHQKKTAKCQPSDNSNPDSNQSSEDPNLQASSSNMEKTKGTESSKSNNIDQNSNISNESNSRAKVDDLLAPKPIREAKKRSLIYTGNTQEFLETAIAAGLIDANGDEEDEDNEYVPPGSKVTVQAAPSSSSESSNASEHEEESECESTGSDDDDDEDQDDDDEEQETNSSEQDDNDETAEVTIDENHNNEKQTTNDHDEPSESGINWNVRNRPQRHTHTMRFNNISKEQEDLFFGALQEQIPALAAYLNEDSDEEFQIGDKEPSESTSKSTKKLTTRKVQQRQTKESNEVDDETVEIMKKFRHVRVPSEKKPQRKSQNTGSTTLSAKIRPYQLFIAADDVNRRIISGSELDSSKSNKNLSPIEAFHFQHRPAKLNVVEDSKAPWRCILCWKEPYEDYLGPLFGAYALNEQCQNYLSSNKVLSKHYRKLKEVWFHRFCALWNNHIQMNPNTGDLMHVSDACSTYLDIKCSICQIPGAALACRHRNCKVRYHYPCAKATPNCRLIVQSYSVYCPKHNQVNENKSKNIEHQSMKTSNNLTDASVID